MINRLTQVSIEGFRPYLKKQVVPLDANIVLVYGPNGCGKSALIYALEFAITGKVLELERFQSDYPQCLLHLGEGGPLSVTVDFESTLGDSQQTIRKINAARTVESQGTVFTKEVNKSFVERCYLPQVPLARLLELYQATDGEDSEQLLIRFVRDLLGLDLLENITSGLYDAGDMRRLVNTSSPLRRLNERSQAVSQDLTTGRGQQALLNTHFTNLQNGIKKLFEHIEDPCPTSEWNKEGVAKRKEFLSQAGPHNEALRKCQQLELKIKNARDILQAINSISSEQRKADVKNTLENIEKKKIEVETKLQPIIATFEAALPDFMRSIRAKLEGQTLTARFLGIAQAAKKIIAESDELLKSEGIAKSALEGAEQERSSLEKILSDLKLPSNESVQEKRRFYELLTSIVNQLHDDNCPVCRRDYREINREGLASKVKSDIESIGGDLKDFEAKAKQLEELNLAYSTLVRKCEALKPQLAKIKSQLQSVEHSKKTAEAILSAIDLHRSDSEALEQLLQSESINLAELRTLEINLKQRDSAIAEVVAIATESKLLFDSNSPDIEVLTRNLLKFLQEQREHLEKQASCQIEFARLLNAAEITINELEDVIKRLLALQSEFEGINQKLENINSAVKSARDLSKAASTVKTKLLNEIFNDTLNGLWKDLFGRLAKSESFFPQLSEPTIYRGKISTKIFGAGGKTFFNNFASVASMGNVNTAALSLFLSLHLIEAPRHRTLILDDPVQSMDDVHVINFAALLKAIAFQADRQIIIAVHERALFDYLCLELGPSKEGQSLIALEVTKTGYTSEIQSVRREWKPDRIKIAV